MDDLSALNQNLKVALKGGSIESEEKIEQEKYEWKNYTHQDTKPPPIQASWFIKGCTHLLRISIFA
jgi:hypothetical protein